MSLNDDDADLKSDIPVLYSDEEGKHPITWVKNNAAITGTLINVGRALRTQYTQSCTSSSRPTRSRREGSPISTIPPTSISYAMRRVIMNDPARE